jgi:hypothetical protein
VLRALPVGLYNFVEIIREKEYPFCVDDPVVGLIGAALPAYRQAGAAAKIGSPCLPQAGTEGLPTISFFNQS